MSAPILEIGEARLSDPEPGGRDYLLRPSFKAMMALGTPEEIVALYGVVHRVDYYDRIERAGDVSPALAMLALCQPDFDRLRALDAAMRILAACADGDLTPVIGEWVGGDVDFYYSAGKLPVNDIITIAQHLIQHGVNGKAKVRQLQRYETNERVRGFNALEYINAARIHLGISRAEAEQLTMTEFQMLLAAKFPDQKGFTREEYEDVADDFLARQAARRAAAGVTA